MWKILRFTMLSGCLVLSLVRPATGAGVQPDGCRVRTVANLSLDQLEDRPAKYIGQRVRVHGVVQRVLGPHAFRIDEEQWVDFERELLVIVPGTLIAPLRERERVIVDGIVRKFVRAELEGEWGLMLPEARPGRYAGPRPVLVADCLIGRDDGQVLITRRGTLPMDTAQTGPSSLGPPLTNVPVVATGTADIVGRTVDLRGVRVSAVTDERGFFIGDPEKQLFVMWDRADPNERRVRLGVAVSIRGIVSRMTPELQDSLRPPGILNREIYLYATSVE